MHARTLARSSGRPSRAEAWRILALALLASLAFAGLDAAGIAPFQRLDDAWSDALVVHGAPGTPARNTVVVDVDDDSLAAVGQWPWPRYRIASLIQKIAAAKPAAIALDIVFPESDRSSISNVQARFKQDFGLDLAVTGVPAGLMDNDGWLGDAMARAGVVGASYFFFDHTSPGARPPAPGVVFDGALDALAPQEATGVLADAPGIASQLHASGFINSRPDADGVLRRMPLVIRHAGVLQPSLALAATMRALGAHAASVERGRDGLALRVGSHRVPIDGEGYALMHYLGGPQAYDSVPAVEVLAGRVDPGRITGRIVFIGTSVVGLNDVHRTAIDARFPGLKAHAVVAEGLLDDRGVAVPSWSPSATLAACLACGVLLAGVFLRQRDIGGTLVAGALLAALAAAGSVLLFAGTRLVVAPTAPIAVAASLCVAFFLLRHLGDRRRAQAWKRQLENERQVTIESMATVAETRDPETGAHIKRTQHYVRAVALQLKRTGQHADLLTDDYIELLFTSAPLHDIGKVGVPDHILLKAGRLTTAEMEQMKQHAEFGRRIIMSTAKRIEGDNYLAIAGEIASTHHEKWDGTGYPRALAGEAIPLSGRIMAVADIYDALISRRCYKEPFSHAHATGLMRAQRGKTFDPAVLDAFFEIEDEIQDIAARFQDAHDGGLEDESGAPSTVLPEEFAGA